MSNILSEKQTTGKKLTVQFQAEGFRCNGL